MAAPFQSSPLLGTWKGLWRRTQESDIEGMFLREAKNVEMFGNVAGPRGGTHRLHLTPLAGRVHALHNARFRNGTTQVIAAAGAALQKLFQGAAVVDPPTALPATLPAGPARTGGAPTVISPLNNMAFIVNAVDDNVKWDGTVLTRMGVDAPTVAPVVTSVAGPGLTGTVGYRYTYITQYLQESEGSAETAITLANQKGHVVAAASPDPQVSKTRLYRTPTDGGGVWLFVAELATNGGTFPDDTLADSALGAQLEEFVNEPPPGPMKMIAQWPQAGRFVGVSAANPSVLFYTDIGLGFLKPESWPPENLIFISFDDGDEIVAVHALFDSLIVQKRRSTWRVKGTPPTLLTEPVHFDEDRTGIGGFAHRGVCLIDNDLFLPGVDGAYTMSRWVDSGFQSARISLPIDDLWASLAPSNTTLFHSVFTRKRRQIRFWVAIPPATEPDRCFVFQLDGNPAGDPNGWSYWEVPATASAVIQTTEGDRVYIGRADGFVEEMDAGFEDHWTGATPGNGAGYETNLEILPFAPAADVQVNVRMRRVDLVIKAGSTSILSITPRTEYVTDWPGVNLTIAPVGTFILDTDPASVAGAGILGDVDASGNPVGGTVLGEESPLVYPCVYQALGRYHGLRIVSAQKGGQWAIHNMIFRWQALPMKARTPAVVQALM